MAATGTPTPNIGLRIPQGTDPASVADINYNSTVIDQKVGPVGNTSLQEQVNSAEEAMAYVINGNDAPSGGIPSGKYVYVKNNTNGIATGMYITTAAISSGATVQASSLSACAEGAANALNSKIANIGNIKLLDTNSNVQSFDITIPSTSVHLLAIGANNMSNVCLFFVTATTAGVVSYAEVYKATYISIASSTNKITISTSDTSRRFYVYDLCMRDDNASL